MSKCNKPIQKPPSVNPSRTLQRWGGGVGGGRFSG